MAIFDENIFDCNIFDCTDAAPTRVSGRRVRRRKLVPEKKDVLQLYRLYLMQQTCCED